MSTYVERIQAQIDKANTATGKDDSTLVQAVQSLVDGYGAGGGDSGAEDMLKGLIERSATEITIPDGTTKIADYGFAYYSGLTSITIPNSVTSIGSNAFFNCAKLASITIPGSVKTIETFAFQKCSQLASVTILNGVTSIKDYAFYNCAELASITIPNSVTSIGSSAFKGINANAVITCKFAEGAVPGAPWGAPDTVQIIYELRVYTVYFYNGSTLLQTVEGVQAGGTATYTGETPTRTGVENPEDYSFSGWSPSNTNIQSNTSCYAQFNYTGVPETITDSWDDIIAAVNNGTYASKYSVGDTKKIDLGTEGIVAMQIAAIDTDALASGSGTAAITWISQQLIATSHRMNPARAADPEDSSKYQEGTGTIGGWEKTEMRSWLKETVKPLIPANVLAAIKPVTKYSRIYDTSSSAVNNVTSTEDVWIPSAREIGFPGHETEGPTYTGLFTAKADCIKSKTGASSASWWWLRSAYDSTRFRFVSADGSIYGNNANSSGAVALGFCM